MASETWPSPQQLVVIGAILSHKRKALTSAEVVARCESDGVSRRSAPVVLGRMATKGLVRMSKDRLFVVTEYGEECYRRMRGL